MRQATKRFLPAIAAAILFAGCIIEPSVSENDISAMAISEIAGCAATATPAAEEPVRNAGSDPVSVNYPEVESAVPAVANETVPYTYAEAYRHAVQSGQGLAVYSGIPLAEKPGFVSVRVNGDSRFPVGLKLYEFKNGGLFELQEEPKKEEPVVESISESFDCPSCYRRH